jgi:hypothetical protein
MNRLKFLELRQGEPWLELPVPSHRTRFRPRALTIAAVLVLEVIVLFVTLRPADGIRFEGSPGPLPAPEPVLLAAMP